MVDSTSISHTTFVATSVDIKCKRKIKGVTMYIKVKKTHKNGVRCPVTVDVETGKAYGEHVKDFMGYIALQGEVN